MGQMLRSTYAQMTPADSSWVYYFFLLCLCATLCQAPGPVDGQLVKLSHCLTDLRPLCRPEAESLAWLNLWSPTSHIILSK